MKYELIESLLIDKELGHLSAKSEQLLALYISENQDLTKLNEQINTLYTLSKKALTPKGEIDLPQFPLDRLSNSKQGISKLYAAAKVLAAAAVLALAFGLGFNLKTKHNAEPTQLAKETNNLTKGTNVIKENDSSFPHSYIENLKKLRINRSRSSLKESYSEIYRNYLLFNKES